MAANRRLQLRNRHRADPLGAAIAGGAAMAIMLVLPVELVELLAASAGLSEAVPALAPPMGWGARLSVALLVGLIITALVWAFSGLVPLLGRRKMSFAWPKSLRWDSLTRIARGAGHDDSAPGGHGSVMVMAPSSSRPCAAPDDAILTMADWLPRRRADMHPDAPPRPPLFASRDLPALDSIQSAKAAGEMPARPIRTVAADASPLARPRPLPRSPQPLSDAQIDSIRALLAGEAPQDEKDQPAAPAPARAADASEMPAEMSPPIPANVPLSSLLSRFETQVERKIAVSESVNAAGRIDARIDAPVPDQATTPAAARTIVDAPQPEMDSALRVALDTLKKLSEQGRKR